MGEITLDRFCIAVNSEIMQTYMDGADISK